MTARFAARVPRSANDPSWTWWREGCGTALLCAGCSVRLCAGCSVRRRSWRTTNGPTRGAPAAFCSRTSPAGCARSVDAVACVAGAGRPQCLRVRGGPPRRRRTRRGGPGRQGSTARVSSSSQERPGRAWGEAATVPRSAAARRAYGWHVESAMPAYAGAATPALTARSVGPGWAGKEACDRAEAPATASTAALRASRGSGLRLREQRRREQARRRQAR
jgi:hypothetical protein